MSLKRVNEFLNKPEIVESQVNTDIILNGADTIKNILMCETVKIGRLERVSNELLDYLTDSRTMQKLSYKEKQNLLQTVASIQSNSRDFIFKVAELSTKNDFLKQALKIVSEPSNEIVQTSNGEVYVSSIDDETRKNLTELLRDVVNERARD